MNVQFNSTSDKSLHLSLKKRFQSHNNTEVTRKTVAAFNYSIYILSLSKFTQHFFSFHNSAIYFFGSFNKNWLFDTNAICIFQFHSYNSFLFQIFKFSFFPLFFLLNSNSYSLLYKLLLSSFFPAFFHYLSFCHFFDFFKSFFFPHYS